MITVKCVGSSTVGGVKYNNTFVFTFDELALRKLAANDAKVQTRSGGDKHITAAGQNAEVYVEFTGTLIDAKLGDGNADNIDVSKKYVDMRSAQLTAEYNILIEKSKDTQYSLEERLDFSQQALALVK